MSTPIYTKTNYRKNLTIYWRQWYPKWKIPKGYHVHHIVPKSIAKQMGWAEEKMNHPRNLIALHPDDHISIHLHRGDRYAHNNLLNLVGHNQSGEKHPMWGKKHSEESLCKMRNKKRREIHPRYGIKHTKETRQKMSEAQRGKNHYMYGKHLSEEHKLKLSNSTKRVPKSEEMKQRLSKSLIGKRVGEKNPQFNGYYLTPFGKFSSMTQQTKLPGPTLYRWCKQEKDKIITMGSFHQSKYLKSNYSKDEVVGKKTYADLGFGFESI